VSANRLSTSTGSAASRAGSAGDTERDRLRHVAGGSRDRPSHFSRYLMCRARGMSHTRTTIPNAPAVPIAATAPRDPSTKAASTRTASHEYGIPHHPRAQYRRSTSVPATTCAIHNTVSTQHSGRRGGPGRHAAAALRLWRRAVAAHGTLGRLTPAILPPCRCYLRRVLNHAKE